MSIAEEEAQVPRAAIPYVPFGTPPIASSTAENIVRCL
jgi:hypothetical protein